MEIGEHWKTIQQLFRDSQKSTKHFAVATVNQDGTPHITPIGALFLRDDKTGYYFDEFSVNMSKNFEKNQRVCILAVNSGILLWLKSLYTGRFSTPPSVRLMGSAGEKRVGTDEEIAMWQNHVKAAKRTKGYDLLWKDMRMVRDLYFDSFEPVRMGKMPQSQWK
jgi:hypothetical protein